MAPAPARFINPIPNPARYQKYNGVTLESLCEAAYYGNLEKLDLLVKSGDADQIFNGDVNMHLTDVNALHMAAMAGQEGAVKLLLEAQADPHVRCVVPEGKDPQSGETARDKAAKFKHESIVSLLKSAEDKTPPGLYQTDGIGNNRKLYAKPELATQTPPKPAESQKKEEAKQAPKAPSLPLALLFPGQGSQYVKMLDGVKDVPEVKEMLSKADSILGYDLLNMCLTGPEEKLAETKYCQPAMFVGGLAGVCKLKSQNLDAAERPRCMAGLSLGEYTALCAAGVLSFEDGLKLVKLRGEAMQEAAQVGKQAMLSVAGLDQPVLEQCCLEAEKKAGSGSVCRIANALFPKGFSCAGTEEAVNELKLLAEKKGALQAKLLKTGGAFHTSLMRPAQEKLEKALQEAFPKMNPPTCDVYMNVTGERLPAGTDPKIILELLQKQLTSPVLWTTLVQKMIKDGITDFYECGPQKQLKAMMKRIDNKVWGKTQSMEV